MHGFILSKYLNDILYLVNVNIRYLEYDFILLLTVPILTVPIILKKSEIKKTVGC